LPTLVTQPSVVRILYTALRLVAFVSGILARTL
jgi:hypothetical protein